MTKKLQGAAKEGYEAFREGKAREQNPYHIPARSLAKPHTKDVHRHWKSWNRGWHLARIAAKAKPSPSIPK